MPEHTLNYLKNQERLSVLILDALFINRNHETHYSIQQAVDLCRILKPKKAFLVGMSGEVDHEEINAMLRELLKEEGLDVQLAYDGMKIELDL